MSGAAVTHETCQDKAKKWRAASAAHELVAPRILIYTQDWRSQGDSAQAVREGVRRIKAEGADGIKMFGMDRDVMENVLDEAHRQGLRSAAHLAVEETTAADFANPYGTDVLTYDGKPIDNYTNLAPGDPKLKLARGGGIEWTITDGIPYHVVSLMKEVKEMVSRARAERATRTRSDRD